MTTIRRLAELYIDWRLTEAAYKAKGLQPPQHEYHVLKRRKVTAFAMSNRGPTYKTISAYRKGLLAEVQAESVVILNERLGE